LGMKKLFVLWILTIILSGCNPIVKNENNNQIFFSWNLREDYELSYTLKWIPEWSWWKYTIDINPVDEWYRWDIQPHTITFLSDVKISNVIESYDDELYPEAKTIKVPELWLAMSWENIEVDNNFWLYCPWKDWDEFILIQAWSGNIPDVKIVNVCIDDNNCKNFFFWNEAYNFMWPVKYNNYYKNWDISMFFEWEEWKWFTVDDTELFSKNCLLEIWEIEDFLPLRLPFKLDFNNFDYTTIWFIKELSEDSDCLSSHMKFSPHNNYISFFTEDTACWLWYETWTTLESVIFENGVNDEVF